MERFPFCPKFRKFWLEIKWNKPFRFGPTGIFGTTFEGRWDQKSLPFDKIVVPSTALLHPAYKNNNQTGGGLGRVCATGMYHFIGHVEFPKF